jgi:single-strand DNA-binding protein
MSQGGYVTLVGFVAQDPNLRTTKDGKVVTDVRVGATRRIHDKATNEWRDLETSYYDVSCWNRLANHVRASLRKGDPVVVKGQFKVSTFADRTGQLRSKVQIIADTVGHDLSRGVANYIRNRRPQENTDGDPAGNGASENEGTPDLAGGSGAMIDEDAIEQFGRDLDADLEQAELAVRALREDEEVEAATPF